jgi:hypothetical protein
MGTTAAPTYLHPVVVRASFQLSTCLAAHLQFCKNLGYNNQYYDGQMAMGHSLSRTPSTKSRRHSTVSFANYGYGVPSTMHVKFKRKGSFSSGIGLDEAQQHILKLSSNDSYSFHDLHADSHRRIHLKIKVVRTPCLFYILLMTPSDYSGLVIQLLHTKFRLRDTIVSTCKH